VHAAPDEVSATVDLRGSVLYHCGPVMLKVGARWLFRERSVDGEGGGTDHGASGKTPYPGG
jgi:hypothetical protein